MIVMDQSDSCMLATLFYLHLKVLKTIDSKINEMNIFNGFKWRNNSAAKFQESPLI